MLAGTGRLVLRRQHIGADVARLSAAQCVHDLDPVARLEALCRMPAARNDFAIHFDRHPALGQAFGLEQVEQGAAGLEDFSLAVQLDFHGRILPHRPVYDATQREHRRAKWKHADLYAPVRSAAVPGIADELASWRN